MDKKIELSKERILIFNECFSSNLGDQAIDQSLTELLIDQGISSKSIYLSRPKMEHLPKMKYGDCNTKMLNPIIINIKGYVYFFFWYFRNRSFLKEVISKYNTFIIGGGQLLNTGKNNYPNTFSIALFWITRLISKKKDYKLYFLGIGTAKKHTKIEELLFKYALNRATRIYVRDQFSQERLRKIFKINSEVIPDVVFYKLMSFKEKENKALVFITDYNKVKKISNGRYTKIDYYIELEEAVKNYQKLGLNVSLAYTTKEDACEAKRFQLHLLKYDSNKISIEDIQQLSQLIDLLKRSKKLFSGRMHALILGKKYGCEVEPQIISDKIFTFSQEYLDQSLEELNNQINAVFN